MMMTRHIPLLLTVLLIGCGVETSTGPMRTETFDVERDSSEFLRLDVSIKAGELQLSGGASKFVEGSATCNIEPCKPAVKYSTVAGRGNVTIEQASSSVARGNVKNEWDLRLPDDIPIDLAVDFGAGEADLNAGTLSLRSVEVRIGAGELRLDLRGTPDRSYDVRVRGGVGEAVIRLPKEAGIYAKASGGIGSIDVSGLRREGDHWVNDAYQEGARTIRVDVQGGIGEIRLIAE
jgi:hypothetical protein